MAERLRVDSKAKHDAAAAENQAAQALEAEIKKLAELRAALAKVTFCDPAATSEAKESEQAKLEVALASLRSMGDAAWQARTAAMQARVTTHQQAATELAKAETALQEQAKAKDASAASLDAELSKLDELQKLIGKLELTVIAKAAPTPIATKPVTSKAVAAPAKAAAEKAATEAAATTPPAMEKEAKAAAPVNMKVEVEKDQDLLTYKDHVYPIFDEYCITCHEPSDASGGLDLSTHATVLQGGGSGKTLSPGNPDASRLYLLVSHKEKPTMPPKEDRIDKDLIETIRKWIQQGAPEDLAAARTLAKARAAAREQAMQEASSKAEEPTTLQVMPDDLPIVHKNYPEQPGSMRTLAASTFAPLLAVPGFHQVLLLHQDTLRELGVLDFPFGQVEKLSFSHDGSVLIAAGGIAGKSGGAVLFDVRSGRELGRFGEQRDVLLSAAASPDGTMVAVGDTRRRVTVTRVADGQELWQEREEDWVTSLSFSADGKLLASADRAGFVYVREAENGREVHTLKAADGLLADLAFSADSDYLATAGADRNVSLFRMRDGRRMFKQDKHRDQVLCIAWRSPTHLVSSGADGRILHWKTNGSNEPELPRVRDWVYDIAASVDGSRVFTADWLGRISAIDVQTKKAITTWTPLAVSQ